MWWWPPACDHDVLCGFWLGEGSDAITYGVCTRACAVVLLEKSLGGAGMSMRILDLVDDLVEVGERSLDDWVCDMMDVGWWVRECAV